VSLAWTLLGLRLLGTLILYTFLGIAFYLIWLELRQAAQPVIQEAGDRLRVISTDSQALTVGQVLPLQPVTLLGHDPDNTIVLPDTAISARHARLQQRDGVWWLENLSRPPDTILNEAVVSQPMPLADGDLITLGPICFRLEMMSQ